MTSARDPVVIGGMTKAPSLSTTCARTLSLPASRLARSAAGLLLGAGLVLAALPVGAGPGHDHRDPLLRAGESASALRAEERQRSEIFKAWYPDRATANRAAVTLHHALLETDHVRGFQVFELEGADIALLQRHGYRLELAADFLQRRNDFLDRIDAAGARINAERRQQGLPDIEVGIQAIPGYACYETVEETYDIAQGFTASHPQLAQWLEVGQSWARSAGLGGYAIGVLKLSNQALQPAGGSAKPILFVQSAMHAREYTTAPLALDFARWLLDGYGMDADATWLLDHHEIHLMLHVNPDGRKRAEAGLSWRKNTNTAYCGPTSNNRGADLNRNFSFQWNSTGGVGSSGNTCNATYRGPAAASEPETQAVEAYVRSLWPDRRGPGLNDAAPADTSGVHIDLHSYSQLVLWPWGATNAPAPNGAALATLGRRFAWFNGYTPTQSIGLYPTDGTSDGVSYGELGVAAFTFELGTSFFQSCAVYTSTIRPNNLPALVYAARVARAPYLLPGGPDVHALGLIDPGAVPAGYGATLQGTATDLRFNQSNGSEPVHAITAASAYIGIPPWQPGAVAIPLAAADGAFDSPTEALTGSLPTGALEPGRHLVYVQAQDASGQDGPVAALFVDVGPPAIALSVMRGQFRNTNRVVTLAWSGAPGGVVDLYEDGLKLAQAANVGKYNAPARPGTHSYQVCVAGSTTQCSPLRSITY
jgi:carboxypeptidase T